MKTINMLIRIVSALTAVAGMIYIIATYGDQIVAWAKKMLEKFPECSVEVDFDKETTTAEETACETAPETSEEVAAEAEEAPVEEVTAVEEAPVSDVPTADEADFEG